GARAGDRLLLTKPLGAGVVTTALKREITTDADVAAAVASMKQLNRQASAAALAVGASGMTDVTGFGLLGHAREMALQAGVDFRFHAARLPWLPGVFDYGRAGAFPGGTGNNAIFFSPFVTFDDGVDELTRDALWTPETSGGLLVAVPPDRAADYQTRCPTAVVVGEVVAGNGRLHVLP
ncbi:MAG: selenide, water dikinase SelD, partial [Anaerolineales bacterium]|nr:selenide, water dikinase SelD [Anaerolineales bacterium]